MARTRWASFALLLIAVSLFGGKKRDDETQVLALPKDPPFVTTGDATRLVFHVSPPIAKGLLSQQTHDAIKAILKMNNGAQIVHLRAFVAGSGDLRRVPQIVSEVFTKDKLPLPSVSVVQAGALAGADAQVVIETVSEAKKAVNPAGIGFIAAGPPEAIHDALAVTCFVSDLAAVQSLVQRFAGAAVDVVQTERVPAHPGTSCEAVVRGGNTGRLAFTGTQVAFGTAEKDLTLAFQRLDRGLAEAGATPESVIATHIYPLSAAVGAMAGKMRKAPGAVSIVPFEGVAAMDASFAIDAVGATTR